MIRVLLFTWWRRAQNRYWDARAFLAGYCNHRPWSPIPDEGGGYAHWRCALSRSHEGLHRARNYVWTDDGVTDYLPVPVRQPMPSQPWDRNMTPSRRESRVREAWLQEQFQKAKARRA